MFRPVIAIIIVYVLQFYKREELRHTTAALLDGNHNYRPKHAVNMKNKL